MNFSCPRNKRQLEKGPGAYVLELLDEIGNDDKQRAIFETVPESMKVTVRIIYGNDLRKMRKVR